MNNSARKVLFVDDEPQFLQLVRRIFKNEDFDILTAENGAKAIEIFKENIPVPLVVTDFRMPGMNGDELIEKLDEISSDTRSIFVSATKSIMVSAHNDALDACRKFPEGKIVDVIQKPVDMEYLKKKIHDTLKNF
ncbi:hypothetical protein UZ36_02745 [Candidatus Nitromaritima sp. SCGC AAA799-C22]|nr:hypothetical protein UZ36_02745 [Candidatus Nitromaritima sp. SCGC AAA799-C22]